jgi:hypothetical protein
MLSKNIYAKKLMVFVVLITSLVVETRLYAQIDAPGAVWQWSILVKGSKNKFGPSTAFMWIPENCAKVKAMVIAMNNMEEFSILENKQFRDSMAAIDVGIVWVSPGFNMLFNVQDSAGEVFTGIMKDLADVSGYKELNYVPMIPMGHSATANFPWSFAAWSNERTLCGISVSGIFPYDFTNTFAPNTWGGKRLDYVPGLTTIGEFEGAGDASKNFDQIFTRRDTNRLAPMSFLPCSGEYHFATSQRKTNFIAYYIKKAMHYRLLKDATANSLAVLKPIDPAKTGWLVDRWRKNMMPRFKRAPVANYTGIFKESFWCFDEEMAKTIEDFQQKYYRKAPTLLAYNQSQTAGMIGPQVPQNNNHVQVHLNFYPLNDSLDFELSSSFLDTIPAKSGRCVGWMSTTDTLTGKVTNGKVGEHIGHPADNSLSVIDREIGPFSKLKTDPRTGITTFRMTLERGLAPLLTNYNNTAILSVAHPGDDIYKASVLQSEMGIPVKLTTGLPQKIDFPHIKNVSLKATFITLKAISDKGLPVQYYVKEGPAQLLGSKLAFTKIPPSAKFPVKVTVVAWQWGRDSGLAARTAGTNGPIAGQMVQTATPIENTFFITK